MRIGVEGICDVWDFCIRASGDMVVVVVEAFKIEGVEGRGQRRWVEEEGREGCFGCCGSLGQSRAHMFYHHCLCCT